MRGGKKSGGTMIFGFNTDIKVRETVYHVQTELREQERRLESQVFVSGRCIGKRSAPVPPETEETEVQEMARAQHRWVVDAIREGFIDDVLLHENTEELVVQFLGSRRISGDEVILRFRVLSGGFVAASAQVAARWRMGSATGVLKDTVTDEAGVAEMRLTLADAVAELEVRAQLENREVVRRFLVKSART